MESVPPGTANQASAAPAAAEEPKKKGFGGMLGGLKKMAEQSEKNRRQREARTRHHHDDVGRDAEAHDGRRRRIRRDACRLYREEVGRARSPVLFLLGGEIRHAHAEVDDAFHRGAVDFAVHLDFERARSGPGS